MTFWKAILLGIIQGLTEFLPVSSSGHLALAQHFFRVETGDSNLFFDIMLHVGTLGAIILAFRKDIWNIIAAVLGREPGIGDGNSSITKKSGRKFAFLILVGLVPTALIGLVLNRFEERLFDMPLFVSGMLIITGFILWLSSRRDIIDTSPRGLNTFSALLIGTAQGIAVLPGISRSGATISTALMRRVGREEAARYSLLLSVPAVVGAMLLKIGDLRNIDTPVWIIVSGTAVAFAVGYGAIRVLLRVLRKGRFSKFAYYCWGIAALAIVGYFVSNSVR